MQQWRRSSADVPAQAKQELAILNKACLATEQGWHVALP